MYICIRGIKYTVYRTAYSHCQNPSEALNVSVCGFVSAAADSRIAP